MMLKNTNNDCLTGAISKDAAAVAFLSLKGLQAPDNGISYVLTTLGEDNFITTAYSDSKLIYYSANSLQGANLVAF